MRKYILSKKEMTDLAGPSTSLEETQQHDDHITRTEHPPEVQPPLPLGPPPVLGPIPIIIKQEIEDNEHQNIEESNNESNNNLQNNVVPQAEPDKTPTICRDFVRGTCKRKNTCKFAHKYDLNQLVGVYTFCHKYQNSYCTYANCKFVHASVFEQQEFYRTGFMPPHALAHHKKPTSDQQPPLQPPLEESSLVNPPSMMSISNPPPPPILNEIETATANPVPANMMATPSSSSLKRPWTAMETFGNSSGDSFKYPTKECKSCDVLDFRLSYNEEKIQTTLQGNMDLMKKISHLNEKNAKLDAIINLLRPQGSDMGSRLGALMNSNLLNSLQMRSTPSHHGYVNTN